MRDAKEMESHSHSWDLTSFSCLAHVTKITKELS